MVTENGMQGDGNTSFLRAARAGNLDKVLEHLKNNIDINTSNANGLNALHLASKDGHVHVATELLRRGATVDSATKKGNTALHIASLAGQEEVVKMLLQHGASVNVQSQNGFTPLYMAAQENHDSVVKLLLSNGANQSLATEDGFTPLAVAMQQGHDRVVTVLLENDTRGKVRLPALHIAAKKDDVKAATLLLDNDHNPDVTSKSGFTPLHIASHYGNQSIANLLIQKGADVNFSAKHNISPLHVAAKWGKTNMVSLLLEKGSNIEAKTRDGLTPLHCAARSGHEQVVDMLLERGAPISAKTKNGLAPLHMAAQGEHVDAARILLYHRAPVDEVTVDYLTALHVAAHCGHVRVAKLLLDRNADANARALNGFTPLHIACKKNRIKVVELLLRHGASISATTESGLTPLHVAAFMGCMNIVIYLLQHDASPDVPTVRGETPLHLAARANQTDIIRILLRNGAQVDARAREQQTPLHIASRLGNVDIVMLLLQHGAQVDATTKDMYTALHIAAKEGQDEVAAVLIENSAALDAATKKGFTPLHLTAKYGHIKVAQLLLQKEADVDAQGKNGVTPLHVGCHYDNQNVALLLLEKGASPHATAKNGHTPLHIAARKNQMDIATTLLEYGAQANAESKAGFTPLHLSSQEGHIEISNLLIEHKADINHPARNGLTPMHLCAQEDNIHVAEILHNNGASMDMCTKAGYTPLHVAAHFGQANILRFLLQHGASVDSATSIGYTPLHQSAQQGHCHVVKLLLEHSANANAQTISGQTPLDIARKLGYISVMDSLTTITDGDSSSQLYSDKKYRVVAPEAMHESFMSDSEEEGGEDNMLSDQPYRYLTVDEMKSLGDDSLPIDVTRDERVDSNRMVQGTEYGTSATQQQQIAEDSVSLHKVRTYNGVGSNLIVDDIYMAHDINKDRERYVNRKLQWKSFLVSFLIDARGGAMRGCRHSGIRMIIPSRSTCQPTRVTCRYVKPQRTMHPPQLMEGEALASRVLELGPVSTKFIGPILMEVPHFASLRGKEREIIILRSDNGETWREHTIDNSEEIIHDVLQQCFEPEEIAQMEELAGNHVCRFVTYDFPQYFAVVTRIRQEVHAIGPEGGMVSSTVVPQVQAVFPQGALTKKIKVGLQAQPVDPDLTAKLLGRGVAVSPIVTVEPRRRKFHKAITLSMPAPKAHSQGMINQYSGNTPTLRLLCSITGGPSRAQWEDVTGSTPLTFVNDCVSFTTTVSARFWLMDCRNISDATKMATLLYKEVIHVPFIARFVVFAKKVEPFEARLRVFCITDDREDKTLEKMELYTQVAKSREVEVLEGKPQYIEIAGNLVPVTKSGEQLQLQFKSFKENRVPFTVRVKDQHADIVGRTLFMKEQKVAKGEPPQHPICILNIVLPVAVIPDSITAFSDRKTPTFRSSLLNFSRHQNDHYIGDIRIVDLSNLLGKDWIKLASEIDIRTEEVDEIINQNTDSIARQAQSMIRLYKDKANYDIHSLEQALKNIGRDDIMNKCKSGRLSHSRDFDNTDIMKNSESVEELVRQESKRIQQICEREEIKYSAEEKEIDDSESDEESVKRTVAERREKIVKRLSIERQIPASSQKKEITREITEIKRKSLIEDKKAIHESEIFMQLPADNSVKSAIVSEQVIKIKMGKMDAEVSKSDFDKELSHKFKSSPENSDDETLRREDDLRIRSTSQISFDGIDNFKIVRDITSVEKPCKIIDSLIGEKPSIDSGSKQLTEDFLAFEKLTQLPSQPQTTTTTVTAKDENIKKSAEEVVTKTVESATRKVENIVTLVSSKDFLTEKNILPLSKETVSMENTNQGSESEETSVTALVSVKEKIKAFTDHKIKPPGNNVLNSIGSSGRLDEIKIDEGSIQIANNILLFEAKNNTSINESPADTVVKSSEIDFKTVSDGISEEVRVFSNTKKEDTKEAIKFSKDCTSEIKLIDEKDFKKLKEDLDDKNSNTFSESQRLTEEINMFAESQIDDMEKYTVEAGKNISLQTNYDIKEHTSQIPHFKAETKSVAETIKLFSIPIVDEIQSIGPKVEAQVEQTKDIKITTPNTTISIIETIKTFREDKPDNISKEKPEVNIQEIHLQSVPETQALNRKSIEGIIKETDIRKMSDIYVEEPPIDYSLKTIDIKSKPMEIREKTVAETIKSFSEHEASISKIEEKAYDTKDSGKKEIKSVSEKIKYTSESFEKSPNAVDKIERRNVKPNLKFNDKIKTELDEKCLFENIPSKVIAKENIEDNNLVESLGKLEEMESIVTDARRITKDFVTMEQQSQLPFQSNIEIKEDTEVIEEIVTTTIIRPTIVEITKPDHLLKNIKEEVEIKAEYNTVPFQYIPEQTGKKIAQEKVLEQKPQFPDEKQALDNTLNLLTETLQHSKDKPHIIYTDAEKLSLDQALMDDKKLTQDFPKSEQNEQLKLSREVVERSPIADAVLIKLISTTSSTSRGADILGSIIAAQKGDNFEEGECKAAFIQQLSENSGVTDLELVKTLTKNLNADVDEQSAIEATSESLPREQPSEISNTDISIKTTGDMVAPRKSLTNEEFCKSVQESITKKMSEGQIKINYERIMKECDIPHSETPPPTPNEFKTEEQKEDEIQQKPAVFEDNTIDTAKTLHRTTDSTFERISVRSTTETLETFISTTEEIVSIETLTTEEIKSTDITPTLLTAKTTVLSTTEYDSSANASDLPKPRPRFVKDSMSTEDNFQGPVINKTISKLPCEINDNDPSLNMPDDLDVLQIPIPKPRSQVKASDSFGDLGYLSEMQIQQKELDQHQTSQVDSIVLGNFDYGEMPSCTENPSIPSTDAARMTSEDPTKESLDTPTAKGNVEMQRRTSFYIGESSGNIITKTAPIKPTTSEMIDDNTRKDIINKDCMAVTDISINAAPIDFDEDNDVFKEYVTIKPTESVVRIRRQSSETRNDLLEEDNLSKEIIEFATADYVVDMTSTGVIANEEILRETSTEQSFTTTTITSTTSTSSAPLEVVHSTGEDDSICEISESMVIETEKALDFNFPIEKIEYEPVEKEVGPHGKRKIIHSPKQAHVSALTTQDISEEMVAKTLEQVQESLNAAKNDLKLVIKDVNSMKESPSEFEFRSFSQTITDGSISIGGEKISEADFITRNVMEVSAELVVDDISSFIGIPDRIHGVHDIAGSKLTDTSNMKENIAHHSLAALDDKNTETSNTCSEDNIIKDSRSSLLLISNETAEDFSSMEEYYQEKFANADIITEYKVREDCAVLGDANIDSLCGIYSDSNPRHFKDIDLQIKSDSTDTAKSLWSVPEIDKSSSSDSFLKSFEKNKSRPLSSDVENLVTQANSSEYHTAAEFSSIHKETTEFISAYSTLESSSGKTISSHESMRSLDSQSEISANLGSIDISELSETLVASSTEDGEEIICSQESANNGESDDSLILDIIDYAVSESKKQQQSQMKRSQEMIFKSINEKGPYKSNDEIEKPENNAENIRTADCSQAKEIEKPCGLSYPMEDLDRDYVKEVTDILLCHVENIYSIDEPKYGSSLDEGSVCSGSMSTASNIGTVVENFEDVAGSISTSFLAGTDEFEASSLREEVPFEIEIEGSNANLSPKDSVTFTKFEDTRVKYDHKQLDNASMSGDENQNIRNKNIPALQYEGKESGSESDTDPYETEYARQFRSPSERKSKRKKQVVLDMDHDTEMEKRAFTSSKLLTEVIEEDSVTEELEAKENLKERRLSQNIINYANIPDIKVTEDFQLKFPNVEEDNFEEKILYKVKTEEQLHKAKDDRPLHDEKENAINLKEENFQKIVQEQYKQKLAELKKAEIGDSDYDSNKAPDSPDSFEMVEQPDICDEFIIVEEVAKEANENDLGGKSIRIAPTKYETKYDEEVEKIIIKSAPADPKLGSQIFHDDLNFEFEESPPTSSGGYGGSGPRNESDSGSDLVANNKRWVEMQLIDNQLRYPYDLTGGVLEDIKEEDAEFEVGSSRISSFKDSFSSTPEYDVIAARRYCTGRAENDDISMSSLQEFESLEQAISLENRNRTHQGSTDSSNGSFQRRYIMRNNGPGAGTQGDDISISSLKEFEGIENACIEAHLIEIKAKEEAALLSRSDESNKSDHEQNAYPDKCVVNTFTRSATRTEVLQSSAQSDVEILLKQKLLECERLQSPLQITDTSPAKTVSDHESDRSVETAKGSSDNSLNMSKDSALKSNIDPLEFNKCQTVCQKGSSNASLDFTTPEMIIKDSSADSLKQVSVIEENSQMSGSATSFASSTLMDGSAMNASDLTITSSYISHKDEVLKDSHDLKTQSILNKDERLPPN